MSIKKGSTPPALVYTVLADPVHTDRAGTISDGTRSVVLTYNGTRLGSIRDPDSSIVSFAYTGISNRIESRTNRRLHATTFTYDAAGKLTQSMLLMGGDTAAIITRFRPLESRALISGRAVAPATAYTHVDGPRTDVADTTLFWLGRYGAVRQIRDAAWRDTRIVRDAPTWPGVATRVERFDGFTQRAFHGATRALLDSTVIVNPLGDGRNAVTRYEWDAQWDAVTRVITPEGPSMRFDYHDSTGVRLWEQPGDDSTRRVTYGYTPFNLVASVTAPQQMPESLYYDATARNLVATRTPLGFWSRFVRDAVGRDTLVITPTDSTVAGEASLTTGLRHRIVYDKADRDTLSVTISPPISFDFPLLGGGAPVETLTVRKIFDAESNLRVLKQRASPNLNLIDTVTVSWEFDRAHRTLLERQAGTAYITRYAYDPAGNVVATTMPGKPAVTQVFDALNRLVTRTVPEDVTAKDTVLNVVFPMYGSQLTIPADTQRFVYDTTTGGLRAATNRYALVRRTFYPNGQLKTDRLHIQPTDLTAPDSTLHVYELGYGYDLNGRQIRLKHPSSIAPTGADSVRYAYDAVTSALSRVTDPLGHVFEFTHDVAGRLATATQPNGITEIFSYDGDGGLRRRIENRPGYALLHDDSLTHTARGQIRTVEALLPVCCSTYETNALVYSGFGAVIGRLQTGGAHPTTEHNRYDAMGNRRLRQLHSNGALINDTSKYIANSQRLSASLAPPRSVDIDSTRFTYDSAGSQTWKRWATYTSGQDLNYHHPSTLSRTWYGPDGRAMVMQRFTLPPQSGPEPAEPSLYEEYRYDAIGRRIWVRSRPQCAGLQTPPPHQCFSVVQRTVWDGDQVLYEIRSPGADSTPASGLERDVGVDPVKPRLYGRVAYTHGLGIDRPLSLTRMDYEGSAQVTVVPHRNWRGLFDSGTIPAMPSCLSVGSTSDCYPIDWPAQIMSTFYEVPPSVTGPRSWFGTLLEEKRDGSGLLYMRNRYYDPKQGRFTQEDPIGLAGGLNLYGYANGDPVNFSDPFGLCPPQDNDWTTCVGFWETIGAATGALIGGTIGGAGGATGGAALCAATVVGTIPCGAAGGAAGGLLGTAKGAAIGAIAGLWVDGIVQMAKAGKGRGGNANPNDDADRVVKEFGLNRQGRRALHDQITGQDLGLDEIRDIAAELAKQAKYLRNPPPSP